VFQADLPVVETHVYSRQLFYERVAMRVDRPGRLSFTGESTASLRSTWTHGVTNDRKESIVQRRVRRRSCTRIKDQVRSRAVLPGGGRLARLA